VKYKTDIFESTPTTQLTCWTVKLARQRSIRNVGSTEDTRTCLPVEGTFSEPGRQRISGPTEICCGVSSGV
jgi:hypothetical protein